MQHHRPQSTWIFFALILVLAVFHRTEAADGASDGRLSTVQGIRHLSSQNYTRVVMDLSDKVQHHSHILKENPAKKLPPRVYVDLVGARLDSRVERKIVIRDQLLRAVRVGQFRPNVVRMVLDMKSLAGHRTFLLPDPFRLVMDVQGESNGVRWANLKKDGAGTGSAGRKGGSKGIKIVLDPGHGGKDPGAIGPGGIAEKDIVLAIAKKLAAKLRKETPMEVLLTRNTDRFVPLEDRTAFANAQNADLFISLHINASTNPQMRGIETYYLDNATDEATIRLAARENGTSRRDISDLQFILSDLTQNSKLEDSIGLAHHLQSSLVNHMRKRYRGTKNLGVKKGLFYVLVGARMPSVLLETYFVTHRRERQYLTRSSFQDAIVHAIFAGIKGYEKNSAVVKNL